MSPSFIHRIALIFALVLFAGQIHAIGVAPMVTAKRLALPDKFETAKTGDILTFTIEITTLPNNATQGAGGYITEYIPANTQVVGARLIDRNGNTVAPNRGPRMDDGYGPRGRHDEFDSFGLLQGSMSAMYADTGIFFSTDPRTARVPGNEDLSVFNGIEFDSTPTGAGQIDDKLGFTGPPYYSHNAWDRTQVLAFGVSGGSVGTDGRGNTPFGFGSPVAGPDTHYPFEVVDSPACSDGINNDGDGGTDYPADAECSSALDNDETAASDAPVGPWQRISYRGSEIGTGGATDCASCASDYVRVGVPTALGWNLSPDNPLPVNTNALRFSIGELAAGQQYFAEISLQVTGLPLDPVMDADVNCAEVFGGDAAMPQNGQDNTWRYYVPSPACLNLDLFFDLEADKQIASQGDTITYALRVRNLSASSQTNVVFTDSFADGELTFLGMLQGPGPTVTAGLLTWPAMRVDVDQEYTFRWQMQVNSSHGSILNRAIYVSDALPAPGFSDVALTNIEPLVVLSQQSIVTAASTSAGSDVRYTITLTNNGTSQAVTDGESYIEISLPTGFSYCAPPGCVEPTINAGAVADPVSNGSILTFTNGLQTVNANGGTSVLEFSANVGGAVTPGQYGINVRSRFKDMDFGKNVEVSSYGLAPLLVDIMRSETPEVDIAVAGSTRVTGRTAEGADAMITVFVNGNPVPKVLSDQDGLFTAVTPTLYQGQRMSATAQAVGKAKSNRSSPEVLVLDEDRPPTILVNTGLTVLEGESALINDVMLKTIDEISGADQLSYDVVVVPANGTLSLNSFLQAQINNGDISYQHDGSEGISDIFYFKVSDNTNTLPSTAFQITVLPVDDPPVISSSEFIVKTGFKKTITKDVFEAVDPDTPTSEVIFEITAVPLNGLLYKNDIALGIFNSFTQQDVNLGRISYEHDGSETDVDGFDFEVSDGSTTISSQIFAISVFEYRIFTDGFEG